MDRLTKEQRRRNMAAVRGKNTKPEKAVRAAVHRAGFRFSLHRNDLPGKPDVVLPKYRAVIFIHGCFWHGHDCPRGKRPATRKVFWNEKLARNKVRDARNNEELKSKGWRVFVIWECNLERGTNQKLEWLIEQRTINREAV